MRSLLFCICLALLFPGRVVCIQGDLKTALFEVAVVCGYCVYGIKRSNEFWKLERVRSCEDT